MREHLKHAVVLLLFLIVISPFPSLAGDAFSMGISTHAGLKRDSAQDLRTAIRVLGADSVRDELYWTSLAGPDGVIGSAKDTSRIVDALLSLRSEGGCLFLILSYGHPAHVKGLPDTATERAAFVDYARAAIVRLRPVLCGIEIWNEWNIGAGRIGERYRHGDPSSYVQLVRAVEPSVRELAPDVPLVVGALSDKDLGWLSAVVGGLKDLSIDGVSVHPYVFGDSDASPSAVQRWVRKAAAVARAAYGRPLGVYVTEIGWPGHFGRGGLGENEVAMRLVEVFVRLRSETFVRGVWWYGLKDKGTSILNKEHNFGLLRGDGSGKRSAQAFRSVSRFLRGCHPLKARDGDVDGTVRFTCEGGKQKTVLLRASSTGSAKLKKVPVACSMVNLLNGEELSGPSPLPHFWSGGYVGLLGSCAEN